MPSDDRRGSGRITRAARIHGRGKVAVSEFELPELEPGELLLRVVSSSMCLSTYKALSLGEEHKRVPAGLSETPVMTGHEFAGVLEEVGADLTDDYSVGQRVAVLPTMTLAGGWSPGYSYPYFGGDATYCIIPAVAVEQGCVLPYDAEYFANGSLAEPMSCIIGAFHASYHTERLVWEHYMGIRKGGTLALLGCGGAMGIGALDYALHGPYQPEVVVAVDVDTERLDRLRSLFPVDQTDHGATRLVILDTAGMDRDETVASLRAAAGDDDRGFDDVVVFAAVRELVELGDAILSRDGCLNFFAGPTDKQFTAELNLYNVHYESTHVVGTSGGSRSDMEECLALSDRGDLNPSLMVTHIAGLSAVPDALLGLPDFTGGKIVAYPHVELDLTAIEDLPELAAGDERLGRLAEICARHDNLWNAEAERYLLESFAVS
jgi:threonine dehydrogenase-like Zn-dependent dehydrogenase